MITRFRLIKDGLQTGAVKAPLGLGSPGEAATGISRIPRPRFDTGAGPSRRLGCFQTSLSPFPMPTPGRLDASHWSA